MLTGMKTTLVSEQPFINQKIISEDNLNTIFPANEIKQLKHLENIEVWECDQVEVVFDLEAFNINEGHDELEALPQLQEVFLWGLPKLRHVWRNVPHQIRGFQNLHRLYVNECNCLRHLLTTSLAKVLVGLKFLQVFNCENMEAIVAEAAGEEEESAMQQLVLFPRLTSLTLVALPKLSKIVPKAYTLNSSSLENLYMRDKGAETWTSALGEGDIGQQGFQNLKELKVEDCDSLRHLLTPSMAKTLVSLETLWVENCESLEAIVAEEEGEEEKEEEEEEEFTTEESILFPKLETLRLLKVPNLLTILPKPYSFDWSSLYDEIDVEEEKSHLLRRPKEISDSSTDVSQQDGITN